MDNYATGNRKCWFISRNVGTPNEASGPSIHTLSEAKRLCEMVRDAAYCRDGYKLVPCHGAAHDAAVNGMIDNCLICAPRWGWVMVPADDRATHLDWCDECFQAKRRGVSSDCADAPKELRRELTHVEKTLLGALK